MRKFPLTAWLCAIALLLLPLAAHPAGLGKLTVLSALGQPLKAEIELLSLQKDEASSMSARMAPAEAFREARIERSPLLSTIRISIAQRNGGAYYLLLISSQPVNEPFLDMLIELNWSSGRLLREYTILLDPPGFAEQQPVEPVAPPAVSTSPAAAPEPAAAAPLSPKTAPKAAKPPLPSAAKPAAKPVARQAAATEAAEEPAKPARPGAKTYGPVKKGETLSQIAERLVPEGYSLEQTMLGLYQANQQAFFGNMSRLKIGQTLRVPDAEQFALASKEEADRQVKIHTDDWEAYRKKLAAAVAAAPAKPKEPQQAASGKIAASVEDKAAPAKETKDVLKLSPGKAPPAGAGAGAAQAMQDRIRSLEEEGIAREKAVKEAHQRIAGLEKSIQEMQRLLEIKSQNLVELQKQAKPAQETSPVQPPAPVPQAAEAAVPPQAAAVSAPPAPEAAPAPVQPKPAAPAKTAKRKPSFLDEIIGNQMLLGGGAVALALLMVLALLTASSSRRRKLANNMEDSILGGAEFSSGPAPRSMPETAPAPSPAAAAKPAADPVAEAEMYLGYGREAQAEEILAEAMAKNPERHDIPLKLLEIYAAQKNLPAFEALAGGLYNAIGGKSGPVWDKVAELGAELDSRSQLFRKEPAAAEARQAETATAEPAAASAAEELVELLPEQHAAAAPDLDLGAAPTGAAEEPSVELLPPQPETTESAPQTPDFDAGKAAAEESAPAEPAATAAVAEGLRDEPAAAAAESNLLEFTLEEAAAETPTESASIPETTAADVDAERVLDFNLDFLAPQQQTGEKSSNLVQPAEETTPLAVDQTIAELKPGNEPTPGTETAGISAPEASKEPDFELQVPPAETKAAEKSIHSPPDFSGISLEMDSSSPAAKKSETTPELDHARWNEIATKLDLAKAYIEMGDKEGARGILQEVLHEGAGEQKQEAEKLLASI